MEKTNYQQISFLDRFKGCIYGLAIGDALGAPTEFMRLDEIYEIFGPQGLTDFAPKGLSQRVISHYFPPAGFYTDDTQMSLATARALIKSKSIDIDEIMSHISAEYIDWLNTQDDPKQARAPGSTCISGVRNMQSGISWKNSGIKDSLGCGAAMRTAPIGLFLYGNPEKLIEVGYAASACTHANPTAASAGVGTAYLTALALNNVSPENFISKLELIAKKLNPLFAQKISQVRDVLDYSNSQKAMKELGEAWDGHEAVALGLYCFLKNPRDYKKTVLMAANTSGDSDSIACIAGAISGAYNGINAIPSKWIAEVENTGLLKQTSKQLYESASRRQK